MDWTIRPMPLAIGGVVAIENIVGRDEEADQVLQILASQHGALLTGDRRMGKTSLARLVEHHLRQGRQRVVRTSAERESFSSFLDALSRDLSEVVDGPVRDELRRWRLEFKAGPVAVSRAAAERQLDDLIERALPRADSDRLVLIIDEIPVLAMAMERNEPGSGIDLLRTLRRIRQDNSGKLAMLLLGSIGFHHVTTDASGTMNDVTPVSVGAIHPEHATYLALCLLNGERVVCSDPFSLATAIAESAEYIPYYVQFLVKACRDQCRRYGGIHASQVKDLTAQALDDSDDPWNMRHYRERIPLYYSSAKSALVEAILDEYAAGPRQIDEIHRAVNSIDQNDVSRRELIRLVERLEQDHYLARSGNDSRFRSDLVRRAWVRNMR